jgi:signal transduction histidine kinase
LKDRIQSDEDLVVEKQKEFLGKFIDGLSQTAYFVDVVSYRITRANAFARTIGFKEGLPCYHRHRRDKPCDTSTGRNCPIPKLQRGEAIDPVRLGEHVHKDGFKRIFEIYHHVILDKNGKPDQLVVYVFENSEKVMVQKALEQADRLYHALNQNQTPTQFVESPNGVLEINRPIAELNAWSRVKETELELFQTKAKLEASQRAERFKTDLLSIVSHELRTPLASIKGFTSILRATDVIWSEEKRQNFLKEIDEETDRLNRLIGDLLDMSRLDAGLLKPERNLCNVSDLFASIRGKLAVNTQNHQLEVETQDKLPTVFIDELRIGQVITNLVDNATKFSDGGSRVKLSAKTEDNNVIISVTDKGKGIPAERIDKIFHRFYSSDDAIRGQRKGLGLGLSICRGIVESHGGKIWVDSKPGKGSRFSFSLPTMQHST